MKFKVIERGYDNETKTEEWLQDMYSKGLELVSACDTTYMYRYIFKSNSEIADLKEHMVEMIDEFITSKMAETEAEKKALIDDCKVIIDNCSHKEKLTESGNNKETDDN